MKNQLVLVAAVLTLSACATAPVPPSTTAYVQNRAAVEAAVEMAGKRAQEVIRKAGVADGPFGVLQTKENDLAPTKAHRSGRTPEFRKTASQRKRTC